MTVIEKLVKQKSHAHYERLAERYPTIRYNPMNKNRWLAKYNIITAWVCNGGILPVDIRVDVWEEALAEQWKATGSLAEIVGLRCQGFWE